MVAQTRFDGLRRPFGEAIDLILQFGTGPKLQKPEDKQGENHASQKNQKGLDALKGGPGETEHDGDGWGPLPDEWIDAGAPQKGPEWWAWQVLHRICRTPRFVS